MIGFGPLIMGHKTALAKLLNSALAQIMYALRWYMETAPFQNSAVPKRRQSKTAPFQNSADSKQRRLKQRRQK